MKRCAYVHCILLFTSLLTASADDNVLRTWEDATGKFKVNARLVEVKGGTVHLEKEGGEKISVPLEKLFTVGKFREIRPATGPRHPC